MRESSSLLAYLEQCPTSQGESGLSGAVNQLYRWGKGLSQWGESVCAHTIAAVLPLFPRENIAGVAFNHNHEFDAWLSEVLPLLELFLDDPQDMEAREMLQSGMDRYLIDCLPKIQPDDERLVAKAEDWRGVERLSRTRWYMAGHVPQHRVALAIRSIVNRDSVKKVGITLKTISVLVGSVSRVGESILVGLGSKLKSGDLP